MKEGQTFFLLFKWDCVGGAVYDFEVSMGGTAEHIVIEADMAANVDLHAVLTVNKQHLLFFQVTGGVLLE